MPQLSIEEFRRIKSRISEIIQMVSEADEGKRTFTDEEQEQLEQEIGQIHETLHSSDLSNIPFEEYEGFIDLGFNFEGTGANLDYALINMEIRYRDPVRNKGCQVRNFDFENLGYDRESFDEEFMAEHREEFPERKDLPEEVLQKYYSRRLSTREIVLYDLYDSIERTPDYSNARKFFEIVTPEVAKTIDRRLVEDEVVWELLEEKLMLHDVPVEPDEIEKDLRDAIDDLLSSDYIPSDTYKSLVKNEAVRELGIDRKLIDFPEGEEQLERDYLSRYISLVDVFDRRSIFRGKDFVSRLREYRYEREDIPRATEEQILYLFDRFEDLSEGLLIDGEASDILELATSLNPEETLEENTKAVQSRVAELIHSDDLKYKPRLSKALERYYSFEMLESRLSEYERGNFEVIMKHTTPEKLRSFGITPKLLEDTRLLDFFRAYGVETIMEFDRENGGIFSRDDFELGRTIFEAYLHYGGNVHSSERTIYHRTDGVSEYGAPYSKEDFEEVVRRMIVYGPTNSNYRYQRLIDYRDFSQGFKTRYPEMFLPENAPQEMQDKFYTEKLEYKDFIEHPEWKGFVDNTDIFIGIDGPSIYFQGNGEYYTISSLLQKTNAKNSDIIDFIVANYDTIDMLTDMRSQTHEIDDLLLNPELSLDVVQGKLEELVERGILSGKINYGDHNIPQFFKDKHPEYVLSDDAPEELKLRYYPRTKFDKFISENGGTLPRKAFTLEDLANPEFRPFLEGKKFDLVRNPAIKRITSVLDFDTIIKLYQTDAESLEVFNTSVEKLAVLKENLDAGQFTSEDIIRNPGFFLAYPAEKRSQETLRQYKKLSSNNLLKSDPTHYTRETYEQILGHMLDFLGFEEAQKLLQPPEIDEETLSHIYQQDELIKSLYEKRFDVSGNIRVIAKLFEGVPTLLPDNEKITSKNACKIFQSINKRMQEGFSGDIRTLLMECLAENGFEIDEEKVNSLIQNIVDVSTKQKLDLVREHNSSVVENNIDENQKTKNMIKMHYRNALEYSLKKCERVDPILVREYLQNEFSKKNEEGLPRYSEHVTSHLEDLIRFSEELSGNSEWGEITNHSVVDDLREESTKIGKGWIRKITTNACYKLDKLTYEQAIALDKAIYPEGSDLEVDTVGTVAIKQLTEEEKKKLYELLTDEQYAGFLSYAKAETMFSAMTHPETDRFRDFFLKFEGEFISNPDLFSRFKEMALKFDSYIEDDVGFGTRYKEGTLTPQDILYKISNEAYKNVIVGHGEHELIYQAKSGGLNEEQVLLAQKHLQELKQREYQTMPQEEAKNKRFRGRIVRIDDPLHFAAGEATNCCQTFGNGEPGESSMLHSASERNGALFIVEEIDEFGKPIRLVAQSWTWRNGNRVCFDNVEIPHSTEAEFRTIGGFDEVMEVYQEAASRMIETDRLKLKQLLEKGEITQEQYDKMVVKDVAMGKGCDDLIRHLSKDKRAEFEDVETVLPLERGKTYVGSTTKSLYTDAKHGCILISHNGQDFEENDHVHSDIEVGDYGIRYYKKREVLRRRGTDIDSDKMETITKLVQKNGEERSAFASSPIGILEVANYYGEYDLGLVESDKFRVSMSESGDWYMLAEERAQGIAILESGIDLSKPESEIESMDRKMAIGEYTREVYKLIQEAHLKDKNVILDKQTQEKFVNLDILVNDGIVTVQNGVIIVQDEEKLQEKIDNYDKVLDKQRRERLLLEAPPKEEKEEQEQDDSQNEL